jgi:hypothetical protein
LYFIFLISSGPGWTINEFPNIGNAERCMSPCIVLK